MESKEKSKVWLVSLESSGLENKQAKEYKKQKLFEYGGWVHHNDEEREPILFPVGYVIEHPKDFTNVWEDYGDGFSRPTNIVSSAIYSGVNISKLEGELLTLMDASLQDKEQCKAIKDLVRQTLWKFNYNQEKKVKAIFEACE